MIKSYFDVVGELLNQFIAEGKTEQAAALIHVLGRARAANEILLPAPAGVPITKDRTLQPFWPGDVVEYRTNKHSTYPPNRTPLPLDLNTIFQNGARFKVIGWTRKHNYFGGCLLLEHPVEPAFTIEFPDSGFVLINEEVF